MTSFLFSLLLLMLNIFYIILLIYISIVKYEQVTVGWVVLNIFSIVLEIAYLKGSEVKRLISVKIF